MARIIGSQASLKGPIKRDENLIAHSWYVVLVVGAIIGAIALLFWMFQAGAASERRWPTATPKTSLPPVVVIQQAPAPAVSMPPASTEPVELSPEELDRRHSEYLRRQ